MQRPLPSITTLWITLVALSAMARAQQVQDATVTFRSHGSTFTMLVPGAATTPFWGTIFDDTRPLFAFADRAGANEDRFVTFRLAPGRHVFSASLNRHHPAKNSQLAIDLIAGKHYYVSAQAKLENAYVVSLAQGRLTEVGCQDAFDQAKQAKPVEKR